MTDLILVIYLGVIVLAFNLMPAFAPPTWTVLVLFSLNSSLHPLLIVSVGALCAGTGRYFLARGTGLFRSHISAKSIENLEAAEALLTRNNSRKFLTLGLFVLSPFPSAQLFEAAGLMGARLVPLTIAFFSGRIITYNFYVFGASELKSREVGDIITQEFTSVWAIALQILMIAAIVLLTKVHWTRFLPSKPE